MLRRKLELGLCAAGFFAISLWLSAAPPAKIEHAQEQRYVEHLKFLASPELEGRGAGTAGLQRASEYIEQNFRRAGLQPIGEKHSYSQSFPVRTGAKLGSRNRLAVEGAESPLKIGEDYRPISFSDNGNVTAGVVFAGYGITAREFDYDDYAGLDVRNKIVLVLRYEPSTFTKHEQGKRPNYTYHSHLVNKAINARNHGAKGVLLVNLDSAKDELIEFGRVAGPENARIPMLQLKRSIADDWLKSAGVSLASARPSALPETFRVSLQVDVERPQATVHNVLGYLPGKSEEYIVIGAHYDHIGYGYVASLAPSQAGQIHPGADDNASGTAGLLELVRIFSEKRSELERGILFVAFAGEELGLLGSSEWVDHPTLPLKNAVAMINLDMIGRVSGAKLYVGSVGSGSTFEEILKKVSAKYDFKLETSFKNSSSSDHASFVAKNVPSLFFYSGMHGDYHRPSDTWNKIDSVASSKVVDVVAEVVSNLMLPEARPQFVKVKSRPTHSSRTSEPYFGIIADDVPSEKGVRIDEVIDGSPADVAGLQAGDFLVALAGNPIRDMYDFAYALGGRKVGDVLSAKVSRNDKDIAADVKLAARP